MDAYDVFLRTVVFIIGVLGLLSFFRSILRVSVLNVQQRDGIASFAGRVTRIPIAYFARKQTSYDGVQQIMGWGFPVFLICLIAIYFIWVQISFTLLLWAVEIERGWLKNFIASGSALSTLGFATPTSSAGQLFAILEGAFGLGIIVFMFTFIPGYRQAVQDREDFVGWMFARIGLRPTPFSLVEWCQREDQGENVAPLMDRGEDWFRSLLDTHWLTPPLMFVPGIYSKKTWVGAAACTLDAAAFVLSSLNGKAQESARACHQTGVAALRLLAEELNQSPLVNTSASEAPQELVAAFDAAYDKLAAAGLPMKPQRDECRKAFFELRSEYLGSVVKIAEATLMPLNEPWVVPQMVPGFGTTRGEFRPYSLGA